MVNCCVAEFPESEAILSGIEAFMHFDNLQADYIEIARQNEKQKYFLRVSTTKDVQIQKSQLAISSVLSQSLYLFERQKLDVFAWSPPTKKGQLVICRLKALQIQLGESKAIDQQWICQELKKQLCKSSKTAVLNIKQQFILKTNKNQSVTFEVEQLSCRGLDNELTHLNFGVCNENTQFIFNWSDKLVEAYDIQNQQNQHDSTATIQTIQNFNKGIGGLDKQIGQIVTRLIVPRIVPNELQQLLSVTCSSKGCILYGPPGCGKTLIARQLRLLLNAECTFVRGPELFSDKVGQSNKNLRNIFAQAQSDQQKLVNGNSQYHLILIDEIDGLCPKRGSFNGLDAGASDQIVSQFLSLVDGLDNISNILIIGTTNRLDSIDDALIRPGRLDQLIEIGPPDESSRVSIWQIHLAKYRDLKLIQQDRFLPLCKTLAIESNNFTGAKIQQCVTEAIQDKFFSFQVNQFDEIHNHFSILKKKFQNEELKLEINDFRCSILRLGKIEIIIEKMVDHNLYVKGHQLNQMLISKQDFLINGGKNSVILAKQLDEIVNEVLHISTPMNVPDQFKNGINTYIYNTWSEKKQCDVYGCFISGTFYQKGNFINPRDQLQNDHQPIMELGSAMNKQTAESFDKFNKDKSKGFSVDISIEQTKNDRKILDDRFHE